MSKTVRSRPIVHRSEVSFAELFIREILNGITLRGQGFLRGQRLVEPSGRCSRLDARPIHFGGLESFQDFRESRIKIVESTKDVILSAFKFVQEAAWAIILGFIVEMMGRDGHRSSFTKVRNLLRDDFATNWAGRIDAIGRFRCQRFVMVRTNQSRRPRKD